MAEPHIIVFYSWASDFPNQHNRQFIQDALERALSEPISNGEAELNPAMDRDVSGVAGAPDIAHTIFEKISQAHIFVGDVTPLPDGRRPTPNPNVLLELGHASGLPHIGWGRVVLVMNEAYGPVESLPFDLRGRRVLTYRMTQGSDKVAERNRLTADLRNAISSIAQVISRSPALLHRGERRPRLLLSWSDEKEEPVEELVVPSRGVVDVEGWVTQAKKAFVSDEVIEQIKNNWDELVDLIKKLPAKTTKISRPPKSFDEVERTIRGHNDYLRNSIGLTQLRKPLERRGCG